MIALLLALAPVTVAPLPHSADGYWHPELTPCVGRKTPSPVECRFRVDPVTEPFRAHVMSEHLDCGPLDRDEACHEMAARWNKRCFGPKACSDDDEAYCIWRSDGAVEAKNATCSDRKGERQ